jgi:hypothetical protein
MSQERYLVFPDEATAVEALYDAIPIRFDEQGEPTDFVRVPKYLNIDTIGIMTTGGEIDQEGNVITEPTVIPGWHVNVLLLDGEDGDALAPYAIPEPDTPLRKWKTEVSV